jgi:hypothetical protein
MEMAIFIVANAASQKSDEIKMGPSKKVKENRAQSWV